MDNNNKWDELSLTEKSEVMRQAVANGITDLNEIRQTYNEYADGGPLGTTLSNEMDAYPPEVINNQYERGGHIYRIPKHRKVVETFKMTNGSILTREVDNSGYSRWFRNGKYITPSVLETYKFYDKNIGGYRQLKNGIDIRMYDSKGINSAAPVYTPTINNIESNSSKFMKRNIKISSEQQYKPNGKYITLKTKGNMNLVDIPTNMLDSIAINTGRSNTNIKTNLGLVGKESTFGGHSHFLSNPWSKNEIIYPHVLTNNHSYFIAPEDDYINSLYKYIPGSLDKDKAARERKAKEDLKYHNGIPNSNRVPHYSSNIMADAFKRYTVSPSNYNRGQGNYIPMVNAIGNEVWNEPHIQNWWNTEGKYYYNKGRSQGINYTYADGGSLDTTLLEAINNLHIFEYGGEYGNGGKKNKYSFMDKLKMSMMNTIPLIPDPTTFNAPFDNVTGNVNDRTSSVAQVSYLLPRDKQQKLFEDYGYKRVYNDYGTVKRAAESKGYPIYQKNSDDASRENLVPIGNADSDPFEVETTYKGKLMEVPTNWYAAPNKSLIEAGATRSTIYYNPDNGKYYQKAWDLNDYGGNGGSTAGIFGKFLDTIGNPVVVTSGIQEVLPENINKVEKNYMLPYAKKHYLKKADNGHWGYVAPDVIIYGHKHAEGGFGDGGYLFKGGGYIPSASIKRDIANFEGSSMKTNRSFEAEAKDFNKVIPLAIRNRLSQKQLDALYSYGYNVGMGNLKNRVLPTLTAYTQGKAGADDVAASMWASEDIYMRGLRRRRTYERNMFTGNSPVGTRESIVSRAINMDLSGLPTVVKFSGDTPKFQYNLFPPNPTNYGTPIDWSTPEKKVETPTIIPKEDNNGLGLFTLINQIYDSPKQEPLATYTPQRNNSMFVVSAPTSNDTFLDSSWFKEGGYLYGDGGKLANTDPSSSEYQDLLLFKNPLVKLFDPTGISSWKDVKESYEKEGLSANTLWQAAGAVPLFGKLKSLGRAINIGQFIGDVAEDYKKIYDISRRSGNTLLVSPNGEFKLRNYAPYDAERIGGWKPASAEQVKQYNQRLVNDTEFGYGEYDPVDPPLGLITDYAKKYGKAEAKKHFALDSK